VLPTIERLLTIAITIPVLEMAVAGAAAGAFWLRFRAPVRDRDELGLLGKPVPAVIAAAVMVALAFSLQQLVAIGWWLAALVVLDALALVWLRSVIHLGLLEEAAEIPIGPPIACANCGVQTPRHTFCISCGVSLRALPKPGGDPDRGSVQNRFGRWRIVLVSVSLFTVISGIAVATAATSEPTAPTSVCPAHQVCANPPQSGLTPSLGDASSAPRLERSSWASFTSSGLGYRFEYPDPPLTATNVTSTGVDVQPPGDGGILLLGFQAAPASVDNPRQLLAARIAALHRQIPDLKVDGKVADQILGPEVGFHSGVGGFYRGEFDSPSGFVASADVAILAATDGRETIAVSVISADRSKTSKLFAYADAVLSTLRFSGDVAR
jgi:hypothetical protein